MRLPAVATPLLSACLAVAISGACGAGHVPQAETADATTPDAIADSSPFPTYDGLAAPEAGPRTPVHAEYLSTRVVTSQLMFAAGEMQTSGEPFAQNFGGRNLAYYDRYYVPVDQYLVPSSSGRFFDGYTDLFGFSSAVESYEYSKYHVNMIAHQTGAGVSLANGPLLAGLAGATPRDRLRSRVEHLLYAAGTDVSGYAHFDGGAPAGSNPLNDFGFPGLWPSMMPYVDFDPTMQPDMTIVHSCTTSTGYGGVIFFGSNPVFGYECAYNSLNLGYSAATGYSAAARAAQIDPVIGPGTLGFATWKYALWGVDFTGRLHDSVANSVTAVAPEDLALVGTQGKTMSRRSSRRTRRPASSWAPRRSRACGGCCSSTRPTTRPPGSCRRWARATGPTLGESRQIAQAIQYDYTSPLVWFPTAVAVTERLRGAVPRRRVARNPGRQQPGRRPGRRSARLRAAVRDDRRAQRRPRSADRLPARVRRQRVPEGRWPARRRGQPAQSRPRRDARGVRRPRPDARRPVRRNHGRHGDARGRTLTRGTRSPPRPWATCRGPAYLLMG